MPNQRQQPRRRGAAATELAILAPLLIAICLSTVDLGRCTAQCVMLSNAVRAGADRGATERFTPETRAAWVTQLETIVRNDFASSGSAASLQVDITTEALGGDMHRVTIVGKSTFTPILHWPFLSSPTLTLTRSVSFRQYR
jgi:Flp pilus assembly protein TadG